MSQLQPNPTKNQHWFPQVFMSEWRDKKGDRLVHVFDRRASEIWSDRKSPRIIGSADYTYKIDGQGVVDPNIFETTFKDFENRAGAARDKILRSGIDTLTPDDRINLAALIMFLFNRRPEVISEKTDLLARLFDKALEDRRNGVRERDENDRLPPGADKIQTLLVAAQVAHEWGQQLAALPWRVLSFDEAAFDLAISDRPVVAARDIGGALSWLTFPLSPRRLLVAGSRGVVYETEYMPEHRSALVNSTIGAQFRNADKFVITTRREPYVAMAEEYLAKRWGLPIVDKSKHGAA